MKNLDWLGLCRRCVERHRRIFDSRPSIAERTRYDGVGEGGDHSLVIDRLCEEAVLEELTDLTAEGYSFTVVTEERGEIRFGSDESSPWRVVIDPIDGSMNARRTLPSHSLSLALASGPTIADVELGFVHDFGADDEYFARRGEGAWLDGARLGPLPTATEADGRSMEVVGLEAADPDFAAPSIEALGEHVHRLRVIGSIAISLCSVAAGRLDGMASLGPSRSVDDAAGYLIATEAGAFVSFGQMAADEASLTLSERYPVAAAAGERQLEILLVAQQRSGGLADWDWAVEPARPLPGEEA